MSVLSVGVHKAIITAWYYDLDRIFKNIWAEAKRNNFPSIHDGEAGPDQPWPYCVYTLGGSTTLVRMSGHTKSERHEIHNYSLSFGIYARHMEQTRIPAKQIAADLAEEVIKVFGGHPTATPKALELDHGKILNVQFANDYGVRKGDDEHMWVVEYNIETDVPVAA